jgi:hypothetical protein
MLRRCLYAVEGTVDVSRAIVVIRALKGRLGYYARPEGRDDPFRARAFAEPAFSHGRQNGCERDVEQNAECRRLRLTFWLTLTLDAV